MIKNIIELKRNLLYQATGIFGLTSEETLLVSQELERFINYHIKVNGSPTGIASGNTLVHSNAIFNILDIALKEKIDLPYEMNDKLLEYAEWFKIDLATTLLKSVGDRYGTAAVEYMGEFVPMRCIFPEEVHSFHEALKHLDSIFHLNHRSTGYIGEYLPFMDIKNEAVLFCNTPHYSSAFNYGIIQGLAKKFNHSLKITILDEEHGGQFKIFG